MNENSSDSVRDLPPVKDVLDWSESIDGKRAVGESLVGGYFNYPPLPTSIAEIRSTMKDNVVYTAGIYFNSCPAEPGYNLPLQTV